MGLNDEGIPAVYSKTIRDLMAVKWDLVGGGKTYLMDFPEQHVP